MSFLQKFWRHHSSKHKKLNEESNLMKSLINNPQKSKYDTDDKIKTFHLKYLGSTIVSSRNGKLVTKEAVKNILRLAQKKKIKKIPSTVSVILEVSTKGLKILDSVSKYEKFHISVYDISCCSVDHSNGRVFAFIATNKDTNLELHAFLCNKRKLTQTVTLAVAESFQNAYDEWLNCTPYPTNDFDTNDTPKTHWVSFDKDDEMDLLLYT